MTKCRCADIYVMWLLTIGDFRLNILQSISSWWWCKDVDQAKQFLDMNFGSRCSCSYNHFLGDTSRNAGIKTWIIWWEGLLLCTLCQSKTLELCSHVFLVCLQWKIKVQLRRSERQPGECVICCQGEPHAAAAATHWDWTRPPSGVTL